MTRLVICEKPSVAADVAKALTGNGERFERQPWGYASPSWLVAAAAGHLVAEVAPEDYDPKYKTWSFDDLPIIPTTTRYQPRDSRAAERLRAIGSLVARDDVTELVNACDAGREGELIFKLIVEYVANTKPVRRAWFASMTTDAIRSAFSKLRPDADMAGLEAAARCRSEADWLVGMNATRAASTTLGGGRRMLSVGRVQTPTLALVVRRDVEIDDFVPTDYFRVQASFDAAAGRYSGWWVPNQDGAPDRFEDAAIADEIAQRVRAAGTGVVFSVEVTEEKVSPPKLFDLTDLQREANRRYGLTAAKTLEAAQACYETHKVLSYPRTDSRYLTSDMEALVPTLVARVAAADPTYKPIADAVLAQELVPVKRVINDAKVNDHHGLVPTNAALDLSPLSDVERKIFDLVARRLLAALLPPQLVERTVIITDVDTTTATERFRTVGSRTTDPGWKIAAPVDAKKKDAADDAEDSDEVDELVAVTEGEAVKVADAKRTSHTTKPPAHFNEASLLGAMASAGQLVDDTELAEAMKETGLGTPATRASIVERLIKVEYLERSGRKILATGKGRGLILALGDHPVTRPDLTGGWERRLRQMERETGDAASTQREAFVADVRTFTTEVVAGFEGRDPEQLKVGLRKLGTCPVAGCGGTIVETPKAYACDSWRSVTEPGCGATFWKTQGGKKVTERQARKWMADVTAGKVTVEAPRPRVVLGPCKTDGCAGEIVSRAKSWGCTSWKSTKQTGCGYVIWRTNPDGTEVTDAEAAQLYEAGQANARVLEVIGTCPSEGCGGDIVARAKSWGCNSWRSAKQPGCGYVIWRSNRDGTEVTDDEARQMVAEGRTNAAAPAEVFADCPRCRGKILERAKSWSCNSYKGPSSKGCGTTIWKMQAGREIDADTARAQLEELAAAKPTRKKATRKA